MRKWTLRKCPATAGHEAVWYIQTPSGNFLTYTYFSQAIGHLRAMLYWCERMPRFGG